MRSMSGVFASARPGGLHLPRRFRLLPPPGSPPCHHHLGCWKLHSSIRFRSAFQLRFAPSSASGSPPSFSSRPHSPLPCGQELFFDFFPPSHPYVCFRFFTPIFCHYFYTSRSFLGFFPSSTSQPTFASPTQPRLSLERGSIGGNPNVK